MQIKTLWSFLRKRCFVDRKTYSMSSPHRRGSKKSEITYAFNFKNLVCFIFNYWIPAYAGMTYGSTLASIRGNDTEILGHSKKFVIICLINIIISGNAIATCTISVPTISFGSFNAGAARTTSVTASVTCSALISLLMSYTVTFSTGSANIYNPRKVVNGANTMNYNLYKNAAFTQILGNGTSSTVTITDSYLLALGPVTRNYTIYASLPANSLAAAGSYQDTITATVTRN